MLVLHHKVDLFNFGYGYCRRKFITAESETLMSANSSRLYGAKCTRVLSRVARNSEFEKMQVTQTSAEYSRMVNAIMPGSPGNCD
jgi:hypothetical protein